MKPSDLLHVTANLTTNDDYCVMKLGETCIRTKKPGCRSVPMIWKQWLYLITAGSFFKSSEPLAPRSLIWARQSVYMTGYHLLTSIDVLSNRMSFSKHTSTCLLPLQYWSDCPTLHGLWWLIQLTRRKSARNFGSSCIGNHRVQKSYFASSRLVFVPFEDVLTISSPSVKR